MYRLMKIYALSTTFRIVLEYLQQVLGYTYLDDGAELSHEMIKQV